MFLIRSLIGRLTWMAVAAVGVALWAGRGRAETAPGLWTGGCLCGAVRFVVRGEPLHQGVCYCVGCRKASGAVAVPWMTVRAAEFHLEQGEPKEVRAEGCPAGSCDAHGGVRRFCPRCGTPFLFIGDDRRDQVDIAIGTLDHPERCRPTEETGLEQRVPWAARLE